MRGKVLCVFLAIVRDRITPAYAGKSSCDMTSSYLTSGSPPPMRGKETAAALRFPPDGITPAYAGKRSVHRST